MANNASGNEGSFTSIDVTLSRNQLAQLSAVVLPPYANKKPKVTQPSIIFASPIQPWFSLLSRQVGGLLKGSDGAHG